MIQTGVKKTFVNDQVLLVTTFGKAGSEKFFPKYMIAVDELLALLMRRFQKFWLQNEFMYKLLGEKRKESELVITANEISDEVSK